MRALVLDVNLQVPLPAFFVLWGDDIVSVVFLTSLLLALHFVYCIDSQIDEWLFVCLYKQRHSYFLYLHTFYEWIPNYLHVQAFSFVFSV